MLQEVLGNRFLLCCLLDLEDHSDQTVQHHPKDLAALLVQLVRKHHLDQLILADLEDLGNQVDLEIQRIPKNPVVQQVQLALVGLEVLSSQFLLEDRKVLVILEIRFHLGSQGFQLLRVFQHLQEDLETLEVPLIRLIQMHRRHLECQTVLLVLVVH